jgi:hypothetical protein
LEQHDGEDQFNTIVEIKKYLSDPQHPFTNKEFMEFWGELTEEEKDEFRRAELE